jgi:hypothetical protein
MLPVRVGFQAAHRLAVLVALALVVAACSNRPGPAGSPAAIPVSCESSIPQATCNQAVQASLAAVAKSGWTPSQVWVSSGQLCPNTLCVFDPDQNYPMPEPPAGGEGLGSVEIAFVETDQHAGLNIFTVNGSVVPVLIGYRTPLLAWCSGFCPTASTTDGSFKLELTLPHLAWKTGDPIGGSADLELTGSEPATISGPAEIIAFAYAEVGGTREVEPIWDQSCKVVPLDPATPLRVALSKSGAVTATGGDAVFQSLFLADPEIRLPAGTWDISAIAMFSEAGCAGPTRTIRTTLQITVTD